MMARMWERIVESMQRVLGRFHPQPVAPAMQAEIAEALSVYLGGNRDTTRLEELAEACPKEMEETILRCQVVVNGKKDDLCELTLKLGYVEQWFRQARAGKITKRREAWSCLSAMAHYEPVRRLLGDYPATALTDSNEQIRLEAARLLLASGESDKIARVFESVIPAPGGAPPPIARELGRHALQLCHTVIPRALKSHHPREVLRLMLSWERALPLPDVRALAQHSDASVRVELMRLLPFLPATPPNRAAIEDGLADENETVRAAAAAAAGRMKLPLPSPVQDGEMELVHGGR